MKHTTTNQSEPQTNNHAALELGRENGIFAKQENGEGSQAQDRSPVGPVAKQQPGRHASRTKVSSWGQGLFSELDPLPTQPLTPGWGPLRLEEGPGWGCWSTATIVGDGDAGLRRGGGDRKVCVVITAVRQGQEVVCA